MTALPKTQNSFTSVNPERTIFMSSFFLQNHKVEIDVNIYANNQKKSIKLTSNIHVRLPVDT